MSKNIRNVSKRRSLAIEQYQIGMETPLDRAALEIAHSRLCTRMPLDEMLKVENLRAVVVARARRHVRDRSRIDAKRRSANDFD